MVTKRGAIFDAYLERSRPSIFQQRRYLLRPEYVPQDLPHRDEQIRQIAGILHVALRGERPSNLLVFGTTGTGKTAVVKHVLREMRGWIEERTGTRFVEVPRRERAAAAPGAPDEPAAGAAPQNHALEAYRTLRKRDTDPALNLLYMNCKLVKTEYGILKGIANLLVDRWSQAVPITGWPLERAYSFVREGVDAAGGVTLVVLDEIDEHVRRSGDDVLYHLMNLNEDLARARLSIVGISNDSRFMHRLEPRVRTRLGEEKIVFPPYDAPQLQDILLRRAEHAFEPGVLEKAVVPLCAELSAQADGDARRALALLRVAGELAEREGIGQVTDRHVHRANQRIELDVLHEVIRGLPLHAKILLLSIAGEEAGPLTSGGVNRVYAELCQRIALQPLSARRTADLITELDLHGLISATLRSFGRGRGRTRLVQLAMDPVETRQVLSDDVRLADLLAFRRRQSRLL